MGNEQNQAKGLRTYLQDIPDPRRRQGRIYPLVSILMMLILAAVNGERSLRRMWIWAQKHWEQICEKLWMEWLAHPPVYGNLWRMGSDFIVSDIAKLYSAMYHLVTM